MKVLEIDFSNCCNDDDLRIDYKFHQFIKNNNWFPFGIQSLSESVKLKDILEPEYILFKYKEDTIYRGVSTNKDNFDVTGDIVKYNEVTLDEHPGRIKYAANQNNVLI